jgi:CheY-like chemotaxis protein
MSDSIKVRLLVVDDEQSIRKLCMTIGTSLGYTCSEAESAEAAVSRIEQDSPDLILTDFPHNQAWNYCDRPRRCFRTWKSRS